MLAGVNRMKYVNRMSSGEKDGDGLGEGHTLLGGVGQDEGLLSLTCEVRGHCGWSSSSSRNATELTFLYLLMVLIRRHHTATSSSC